jgi:predicted dehydrogenase
MIMADQVKIGVVGTSWWADMMFLPIFAGYERANLAAICGRNRERAEEMAAKHGVPRVFTDYREMIEHGNLDAIVVATPDDTHYEITMAALEAGLHVLCDKPVALNASHAKTMYERAEAAHLKHMVMYTWHWLPTIQQAKQIIDQGYVGKFYHGSFQWFHSFGRSLDYQWRWDAEHSNGVASELGSHLIHMAQWLIGDVTAVSARLGFHVKRHNPDGNPVNPANDSARMILEFANGAQVDIEVSGVSYWIHGEKLGFSVYGERGTVEAGTEAADERRIYLRAAQDGSKEILDHERVIDHVDYFKTHPVGPRQFIDAILDDKPIYPGLYEGYKVQQVIDAALESHRTGCRVAITP